MRYTNPIAQLVRRCTDSIETYRHYGDTIDTPDGPLTYIDNGADTLAVVHLDYVLWRKPVYDSATHRIICPQLDDRLGLWAILDMLPALGVKSDVLLTDSEEVGRSTARYFNSPKQYNWMYQFDRHGIDSVLYEYDSDENRSRLIECGLDCTDGTFSDICRLSHLGCSGWNIGTAYHHEHTPNCYASLGETETNVRLFADFWKRHHATYFPKPERLAYAPWSSWDDVWDCPLCEEKNDTDLSTCRRCGEPLDASFDWEA